MCRDRKTRGMEQIIGDVFKTMAEFDSKDDYICRMQFLVQSLNRNNQDGSLAQLNKQIIFI